MSFLTRQGVLNLLKIISSIVSLWLSLISTETYISLINKSFVVKIRDSYLLFVLYERDIIWCLGFIQECVLLTK